MSVFRIQKDKDNPYVMLNKQFLNDSNLSAKAKGVLAYLLSLPDDWQIYERELVTHFKDGRDSIRAGIQELIQFGYILRNRIRDEKGRLREYEYRVYEVPVQSGNSNLGDNQNKIGLSNLGETNVGKPYVGKNDHTNNDLPIINSTDNNSSNNKEKEEETIEVLEFYKAVKGKDLTNVEKGKLNALVNEFSKAIVLKAADVMSEHTNTPTITYLKRTLRDWYDKGLDTIEKVEYHIAEHEATNQKAKEEKQKKIKTAAAGGTASKGKNDTFTGYGGQRQYDFDDFEKKYFGYDDNNRVEG